MLSLADVAQQLGIKVRTLTQYRSDCKQGRRYVSNPFPEPVKHVGRAPLWADDQLDDIVEWAKRRTGQGIGGGRRIRKAE